MSCAATQLTEKQVHDIGQIAGLSGHLNPIRGFPGSIKATIRQSNAQSDKPIPDSVLQTTLDAVDSTVDSRRMATGVAQAIGQKLSAEDTATLLSWYRSATGQKIARLEALELGERSHQGSDQRSVVVLESMAD